MVEHDAITALDQVIQVLERRWVPVPDRTWSHSRFFGYVPLPIPAFLQGLDVIGHHAGRSFIDIGCGVATKLLLLKMLGWPHVYGLARYPEMQWVAQDVTRWQTSASHGDPCQIFVGDARDFDRYDQFDIVYQYRLCIDDDDQRTLEDLIVSRMKPGALAFFPQGLTEPGEALGHGVWRV